MIAKLVGMVARVDRLTSIDVAAAGEPVLLTDTQLDMAVGGYASAVVNAVNVTAQGSTSLSSTPTAANADVNIFSFNNVGTGTPHVLVVGAIASVPSAP